MRKRVYICGPISKGVLADNVNRATEAFVELAKLGFAPFCPHWSVYSKPCESHAKWMGLTRGLERQDSECECIGTVGGNDYMTHDGWIEIDLPWVVASDAVLRLPGESVGADAEVSCARDHNVPVFHSIDELVGYFKGAT